MPLPTAIPETAESAYARVVQTASAVSSNLRGVRDLIAGGGPVYADNLIGLYQALNASRGAGQELASVEGLGDYAKGIVGPDYDIYAAFGASIAACTAVTDWLLAHMPGDGSGGYLGWRLRPDSTIERVTIPAADLAPLGDLIDDALATFA